MKFLKFFDIMISCAWTILLIGNVALCASGHDPSWITTFSCLITLTMVSWIDTIKRQ